MEYNGKDSAIMFLVGLFIFCILLTTFGFADTGDIPADVVDSEINEVQEGESGDDGEHNGSIDDDGASDSGDLLHDGLMESDEEGEEETAGETLTYETDYDLLLSMMIELLELLQPVEEELPEPPAIHDDIAEVQPVSDGGIMPMSIITQAAYPYTGGGFMQVNTNYGNGLVVVPEPYKLNTFGFLKNTDRMVNLTNSMVSGYFIMGGTTYNARFQTYGQLEYYRPSGNTYVWTAMTVSSLNDTNIQFLDETGERGIQNPVFSLSDRLLFTMVLLHVVSVGVSFMKRR